MFSVSISLDPSLRYPAADDHSPNVLYPEYAFKHLPLGGNRIYSLLRMCLQHAEADYDHFNTRSWNPLGKWIKPGERVFVLPNFVMHPRPAESIYEFYGKCTHGSVLRPVLDYVTNATGSPGLVSFGNAPIQACDYERATRETGAQSVGEYYKNNGNVEVGPYDLRLLKTRWTGYGALIDKEYGDEREAVLVDLGENSLLEELFRKPNAHPVVRVADYPPDETMTYHGIGKHIYVVSRRILEANVIVSVPKLKTHQKTGMTCALKGTVGIIARKECLAHHRRGGPEDGGDEYPRSTLLRNLASSLSDKAAGRGADLLSNMLRVGSKGLSHALGIGRHGVVGGAWHGNDTAWRMALDIARILRYANIDGTLSNTPIRKHLVFVDGIIAGEGEGPLRPKPRGLGLVLFSPDPAAADIICAWIMGYDPRKIPLLSSNLQSMPFALSEANMDNLCVTLNGKSVSISDIPKHFTPPFLAPKGWQGAIEADMPSNTAKGTLGER